MTGGRMLGVVAHEGRAVVRRMARPSVGAGHVRMRVLAAGINRADLLQVQDKYAPPAGVTGTLGLECAGLLPDGSLAGALVAGGALAEEVAVPVGSVMRCQLDATRLAAVPEAFLVAHHLLFDLGGLAPRQSALIAAAGSGVGTALVQLAAQVPGAVVVAAARGERKRAAAAALGAHHVLDPRDADFARHVRAATDGGAHLLLDCIGAASFRDHARALRMDSRWVLYGLLGGARADDLSLAPLLARRITLLATTLRSRSDAYKAALVSRFCAAHAAQLNDGTLRPVVDRVFEGLHSTQQALDYLEANRNVGKIVVTVAS